MKVRIYVSCLIVMSIWSFSIAQPIITINLENNMSCFSAFPCDGSASLSIDWNGEAIEPFFVEWTTLETSTQAVFLCEGWQKCRVTFDSGLSIMDSILVSKPEPLNVNLSIENEKCKDGKDGSIDILEIVGGTPDYNIAWNDGYVGMLRTSLAPDEYGFLVSDANECQTSVNVIIEEGQSVDLSINEDELKMVSCHDAMDGEISLTTDPFSEIASYTWMPNVSNTSSATNLLAGIYRVIAASVTGCIDTLEYTMDNATPIELSLFHDKEVYCEGEEIESRFSLSGGIEPLFVFLDEEILLDTFWVSENDSSVLSIEDTNGCRIDTTIVQNVIKNPQINTIDEITVIKGQAFELDLDIDSEAEIESIYYSDTTGVACTDCITTEVLPLFDSELIVTVKNIYGCIDSATIKINVVDGGSIYAPNIFSPNGDGVNDECVIYFEFPLRAPTTFLVYDRYGNSSSIPALVDAPNTISWNGNFGNKVAQPGVYVLHVPFESARGQHELFIQSITVIH